MASSTLNLQSGSQCRWARPMAPCRPWSRLSWRRWTDSRRLGLCPPSSHQRHRDTSAFFFLCYLIAAGSARCTFFQESLKDGRVFRLILSSRLRRRRSTCTGIRLFEIQYRNATLTLLCAATLVLLYCISPEPMLYSLVS